MSTVLVTGANRGIGLELVRQFVARDDTVFATCRDPASATELNALAKTSPKLNLIAMEVTDAASIAAAITKVDGMPIDILINNAGVIGPKRQSSTDMDFDGFLDTLDVNTLGPLRVLQAFLPNLSLCEQAYVLTVTSRMGSLTASPGTDRIAYRASKAALNRVMQAVAGDLRGRNIAVSVAHPGWVRTDMGGGGADITPSQSAAGLIHVIDRMTISKSPRFFNYDGSEITW